MKIMDSYPSIPHSFSQLPFRTVQDTLYPLGPDAARML